MPADMGRQELEGDLFRPAAERAVNHEDEGIALPAPATCGEGGGVAGRRGGTVVGVEDVLGGGGRRGAEDGVLGVEDVLGGGRRRGAEDGALGVEDVRLVPVPATSPAYFFCHCLQYLPSTLTHTRQMFCRVP